MGEEIPQKASFHRKYVRGRMQVRERTDASTCEDGCRYVRGGMQCTAWADAVHCKEGLQCTASEMGKTGTEIASPILDRRKGREKGLHMEAL